MKTYFRAVYLIAKSAKKQFYAILILSILVGMLEGLQVKFNILILTALQNIIGGGNNYTALIVPFIAFVVICPSYYLYTPADAYLRSLLLQKFRIQLLKSIYHKTVNTEMKLFEDNELYDNIYKAQENAYNDSIMDIVNSIIYIPLLISAIGSIFSIIGSYNPMLMLLAVVTMIPYFISRYLRGKEYFILRNNQTEKLRVTDYLWEILCGRNTNRDMRIFGTNEYMQEKYYDSLKEITEDVWKYEKKQFIRTAILDSCRPIGLGIGIILSSYMAFHGDIAVSVFAAMFSAFSTVQEHAEGLIDKITRTTNSIPFISNYFNLINDKDEIKQGDEELTEPIGTIQFINVCFRYPHSKEDTIRNLSLTINKNESISILGENGAGKSTFSKLLLGLYTPTSGDILYNGVSIFKLNRNKLYEKVSTVFQDFTKYKMTVYENMGFGRPDMLYDKSYIQKYIENHSYLEFIQNYPNGVDTVLGREYGGVDISGGQWQKIAIARGDVKPSDLIVLDEPTASLDPLAEADIFRKFLEMSSGKISLIVSHRIGAARLSNRILVMSGGRIVEDGTPEKLLNQNGVYAQLYKSQSYWYQQ